MEPSIRRLEPPFQLLPPISTSSKGGPLPSSSSSIQQHPRHSPSPFLPSSPLASSFPSLQQPSQSNSFAPIDSMDLPLPSPSFREGHGHHNSTSTSTSASSFNSSSALDSPGIGGRNHRAGSGIDTPPSSTMGSPPTDFTVAGGGRGWGGNRAVMGSRKENDRDREEEEAGPLPDEQHYHHHTQSYDSSHHQYAGSSRSDRSDSIFHPDDRASMTTPDFISSFDQSSSKPWTSTFGGPVASTSTSSAPPSYSTSHTTQFNQPQASSSSMASSSRTRDTASSTSSLPPTSTRGPPLRSPPQAIPSQPSSLVPLTMVHEQGNVYVETTSAEAARAYKKELDKKEGVEGGSSKRSPFMIESGTKSGRPIFMIRRRSNSAVDPVLLRALSPINPPCSSSTFSSSGSGPSSPRSPKGPVAFLPLARPSSPNNSTATAAGRARSPTTTTTTTAAVKPKGRLLRLSQSMQSMGAAYGSGKHKVVEPVVPGSGRLAFPEGNVVRQFFGTSDRTLSSVPDTLNNPLISITSSSPSPRRRQSALTLQTFPSSSLGGGSSHLTSPTRTRTSSRPVNPDQPMSPTQRIRLLSQQLFKPGERPSVDENVNAPLKPKSSSGSLRGLFLRKMGSVPALRGMQSFESGGSGETARPEERDSSKSTPRRPRRDSAQERLSSEEVDRDVTPRPEEEKVVLLGPVPVAAKERSSGEDASKLLFPTQAPPAASPPLKEQTFTTQIFDIFQEYRGDSNADLEPVAPGDDPRFVVWKVSLVPQSQPISKRASASPSSASSSSNPSPIALTPGHPLTNPSSSSSLVKTTRTLEAATIERWVAQITFTFNLEVWLDFFLVYRAYISPLSLCRLLMARFEWGCRTNDGDGVDLRGAKQLAASRACYVLRVWLTGFFEVDWLNGKQMRLEFTKWLNALSAEKKGFDKLSRNTLSKLRKVVRELKDKYDSPAFNPLLNGFGSSPSTPLPDEAFSASSFATAQAANRLVLQQTPPLQQQHHHATIRTGSSSNRSGSSSSNSFSPQNIASLMSLPSSFGRSKIPKFFRSIGKGTFGSNRPMIGGNSFENDEGDFLSRKGGVDVLLSSLKVSSPPASDFESSAASMSEDSHGDTTGSSSDTSGRFNVAGLGNGGVEVVDSEMDAHRPSYQSTSLDSVVEERPSHEMERPPAVVPEVGIPPITPIEEQAVAFPSDEMTTPPRQAIVAAPSLPALGSPAVIRQPLFGFTRDDSPPAASSDIQNAIIPFHTLDIDDADFSSSDDDSFHQPIRRLPAGGPQLQLVRRSIDTLSSYVQAPRRGSTHSTSSAGSNRGSGPQPFNYELLKEFRVDELESDEDDDGGAEGALLRLEGKFDPEKQKAKNAKVEFLVQQAISKSRNRSASIGESMDPTGARRGRGSHEDRNGFGGRESLIEFDAPAPPPPPPNLTTATSSSSPESETSSLATRIESATTEPDMDLLVDVLNATPSSRPHTVERPSTSPLPSDDATPNLLSTPRPLMETKLPPSSYTSPPALSRKTPVTPSKRNSLKKRRPSNPAPSSIPRVVPPKHVCFIFKFKTDLLALHFAHIDAQLMNGISFVELGSLPPPWLTNPAPQLDSWEALLSERTSRKVHGRPKISDASMWVRRFEMMSRWVESEIILTPRLQRPALISRFVKLAWKSFELSDFLSTVAIISGLQTPFVKLSLGEKAWSKVSLLQELNYLRNLTSPDGGYANLRRAHSAVADQHVELFEGDAWSVPAHGGAATGSSTSASTRNSVGSDGTAGQFYIPFMGIYLQDLEAIDRAPDFGTPQLSSDLVPLPDGVVPGPLINVAKAKQRAKILREVIVFNTLASKYPKDVDGGVYRLCLKLSALPISSVERLANDLRSL